MCGSEPRQLPVGNSVRILTFNTQILSPWFSLPSDPVTSNSYAHEKAVAIGNELRKGKFDVISFDEVWDDNDGKDTLINHMCPTYPNFVRSTGENSLLHQEDSGLMIFSKLAFLGLPDTSFVGTDTISSLGTNSNRVAATAFTSCDGFLECQAEKSALMVRLAMPDRTLNFVATHLQADAGEDAVRKSQMEQIRGKCESGVPSLPNLITTTLGLSLGSNAGLCAWQNTEWLAITGDHNIQGEGAVRTSVHPGTATPQNGPSEWEAQIGQFVDAVATNHWSLFDAWAETTSPDDLGITHQTSGERLDYILTSKRTFTPVGTNPAPDMCVQYVWNPPELHGLSDHEPLAADLNLMAPQCNPRKAYDVKDTDVGFGNDPKTAKLLSRNITFPGSMQWFKVDEPGTYSIALSNGLSFERFDVSNLSVPLGGSTDLGSDSIKGCVGATGTVPACITQPATKFVATGPFYIRVFSTDRAFSGSYTATIYKYTCNTPALACEMLPNSPVPFSFPAAGTMLDPNDTAWFKVQIREQADSGAAQTLRFHADNTGAPWTAPNIAVMDSTGSTVLSMINTIPVSAQGSMLNPSGQQRVFRTSGATTNQTVLLRIRRPSFYQNLSINAGWQTNLTLIGALRDDGATLVCDDETNPEIGSDEIRMRIQLDGTWQDGGFAQFDCNNAEHHRDWSSKMGVVRALSGVNVKVLEEDDFLNLGDDPSGSKAAALLPLESVVTGLEDQELTWNFDDGKYHLDYLRGKWRE